ITDNEPIITVAATDATAGEAGPNTGTFVITRTNTSGNLVVTYTLGGTATNVSDYSSIAGSVTIPNGSSTVSIVVTPIDDALAEQSESVTLTLTSSTTYSLGTPS